MSVEIAIIIINYRTPELTLDCLRSLCSEVDAGIRVVVVDNDSGDGSAERIERALREEGLGDWTTLLRSPSNGGFASGNNFGIRSVRAQAYLLLNSDTIVQPGAIAGLREAMRARPDAGVIGPGLLNVTGGHDDSVFRAPGPAAEFLRSAHTGILDRALPHLTPVVPETDRPIEADWLGFACVLVRAEVLERVGGLDEGYFMYFEDIDYCRRVRDAGWKVLYWPAPKVIHLLGGSSSVTKEAAARRRAPRYYYEARARYFAKFYGRRGLWLANGFWYLGRCISLTRELLGNAKPRIREREALDIWTNALDPLREPRARAAVRA
jgi:N-acetylglucosaminyl-diphospho-decaprenol L-rhamnosyltransferase